jgi:peptidoglycan hydrolase-like protein with peptidoglycan-binding domain
LLVSYGDQNRYGAGCDGVTKITDERAQTLKAAGISHVGRYLVSMSSTSEKAIQPGELATISANNLRCFPIYQTYGRGAAEFSYAAGRSDAQSAINAALDHGFKTGTRIFFAVDFDAYDYEITDNVLPHFKGIQDAIEADGGRYEVGIYGPRNVCIRVGSAGHSSASFVSDLSSGFSGNFGYPLPPDWAYDQFVTKTIGAGAGAINLDIDVVSGRDNGQGEFNPPRSVTTETRLDSTVFNAMSQDIDAYMQSVGRPTSDILRTYSHDECFTKIVVDWDETITNLSHRYQMKKALIQTSAYWEMRHVDPADLGKDEVVMQQFQTTGTFRDSSTGVIQCQGRTAMLARNLCVSLGYYDAEPIDPNSDAEMYGQWLVINGSFGHDPGANEFSATMVALVHLWATKGKPGDAVPENEMREMTLNYTQQEVHEVLRRYQGSGDQAENDNVYRMGLYQIMEKYNAISRNG